MILTESGKTNYRLTSVNLWSLFYSKGPQSPGCNPLPWPIRNRAAQAVGQHAHAHTYSSTCTSQDVHVLGCHLCNPVLLFFPSWATKPQSLGTAVLQYTCIHTEREREIHIHIYIQVHTHRQTERKRNIDTSIISFSSKACYTKRNKCKFINQRN